MPLKIRCGPDWLHQKLAAGGLVVIDGAIGTELEYRGVPMDAKAWSGAALLSHPELVRAAHADYIAAGSEVSRRWSPNPRDSARATAFRVRSNQYLLGPCILYVCTTGAPHAKPTLGVR